MDLSRFIHKLHYRTFDKIWQHVHANYPNVTEQEVKDIIKSFVKDPPKLNQKKYYNRIYSDHLHAWMMDLLDNQGETEEYNNKAIVEVKENSGANDIHNPKYHPTYWYIFININTRFAVAYPLLDKTADQVLIVLRRFISQFKCTSLTSDKEAAFISPDVVDLLKAHHISQYIVTDNNHTSLAIIDSFIRHLRDRNITNEKSKHESYHSKYRNFSVKRMHQLINIYNNTVHSATGYKPIEMERDPKLERQYIANCLIKKYKSNQAEHTIPTNHYVRIVLAKDVMKKRRFKVSRECYKISGRDGMNYLVSASDNTTLSLPRHRLIDIGDNCGKYKFATTMPNGNPLQSYRNKHHTQLPNFN